jgi:FtsP/CotA-like multicopper oxidase with cupredoxin domain
MLYLQVTSIAAVSAAFWLTNGQFGRPGIVQTVRSRESSGNSKRHGIHEAVLYYAQGQESVIAVGGSGLGAAVLLGSGFVSSRRGLSWLDRAAVRRWTTCSRDAEIDITAAEKVVQILPGAQARVRSYEGQLLRGSGMTATTLPGNYLGPILRAKSGTKARINFHNILAEDSVVYPHGLLVPERAIGRETRPSVVARPKHVLEHEDMTMMRNLMVIGESIPM